MLISTLMLAADPPPAGSNLSRISSLRCFDFVRATSTPTLPATSRSAGRQQFVSTSGDDRWILKISGSMEIRMGGPWCGHGTLLGPDGTTDLGEIGEEFRSLAPAFVGRHVVPRCRGYMQSQALRLLGLRGGAHGKRGGGQREELVAEHGYDTKYAMHAARLGFQCIELLTTNQLALPIEGEPAEWLLDVRHGRVSFDDWWGRCLDLDAQLERLADDSAFAPGPDRERIETWTAAAHRRYWQAADMTNGIPSESLVEGRASTAAKRRKALDEMTREAEELGLYD